MFKALLLCFSLLTLSWSLTLDEVVKSAIKNNHDLKSIENAIEVASKQIELSSIWKNPTLSLGVNDIQFDDVSKRDLEAMQAEYIGFSQIIPMGNKLEIQKEIAKKESSIALYTLEDKKLQLKSKIYEYGYKVAILEKKYELLEKYQNNIKSQARLLHALYENGKLNQVDVMNVNIAEQNLELKKINLKNRIRNLYLRLEEISYIQIPHIDTSLKAQAFTLEKNIDKHPRVRMVKEKAKRLLEVSRWEHSKKNSDIKVNVAYFSRDNKFEDYGNISVSIPLSIYNSENIKSLQAKIKAQEMNNKLESLEQQFTITIQTLQNSINSSLQKYQLLTQTLIPLKNDIQTSMEAYNSLDQIKPQATIKSLNEIIAYELMSLDELNNYFSFIAQSIYYVQGNE